MICYLNFWFLLDTSLLRKFCSVVCRGICNQGLSCNLSADKMQSLRQPKILNMVVGKFRSEESKSKPGIHMTHVFISFLALSNNGATIMETAF